jgi:hypothetical protein
MKHFGQEDDEQCRDFSWRHAEHARREKSSSPKKCPGARNVAWQALSALAREPGGRQRAQAPTQILRNCAAPRADQGATEAQVKFPFSLFDLIILWWSGLVILFILVGTVALAAVLKPGPSTRARCVEGALLSLVGALPLVFDWSALGLLLPACVVVRLICGAPGNRLSLAVTAVFYVLSFVERSFWVGACLSPMLCALLFRTKPPGERGSGNYGQLSSPAASV